MGQEFLPRTLPCYQGLQAVSISDGITVTSALTTVAGAEDGRGVVAKASATGLRSYDNGCENRGVSTRPAMNGDRSGSKGSAPEVARLFKCPAGGEATKLLSCEWAEVTTLLMGRAEVSSLW